MVKVEGSSICKFCNLFLCSLVGPEQFVNFGELAIHDSPQNRDFELINNSWINSSHSKIHQIWWIAHSWFIKKGGFRIDNWFKESWVILALFHGHFSEIPRSGFFVLRPNQKLRLLENYRIGSLGRSFGFCQSFSILQKLLRFLHNQHLEKLWNCTGQPLRNSWT